MHACSDRDPDLELAIGSIELELVIIMIDIAIARAGVRTYAYSLLWNSEPCDAVLGTQLWRPR